MKMAVNPYHALLRLLTGIQGRLNIVIVGANDGMINDPIYEFVMAEAGRTRVLLIEPLADVLPYLRENYSRHPDHRIANYAVGKEKFLHLFVVKKDWWERFRPAYAEGWPPYRAPMGISSSARAHLEQALRREGLDPDEAIGSVTVPAKELSAVLAETGWQAPIDVLQVDAEGCDDSVIRSANLESSSPRLILFEHHNMSRKRLEMLADYLSAHRYRLYPLDGDTLAVRSRLEWKCMVLNAAALLLRGIQLIGSIKRTLVGSGKI